MLSRTVGLLKVAKCKSEARFGILLVTPFA